MTAQGRRPALPASWLRTVQTTRATLVVDYRTGVVVHLHGEAKHVWDAIVAGQRPNRASTTLDSILTGFAERGWLATAPTVVQLDEPAASWGTQETPAALPTIGPVPWSWRLAALPAVAVVLLTRQLSRRHRFARLLWLTRRGARLPRATILQARHAVRAVRHAARLVPAKVACLEESVAATVLLAAAGRRGTWCHGIATDPVRLHAWLADRNGDPIEEPSSTARYIVINQPVGPEPEREGDQC